MFLHEVEGEQTRHIDTHPWAQQPRLNWSHDSSWIAYTKGGDNRVSSVWLYNVANDEKHQVNGAKFDVCSGRALSMPATLGSPPPASLRH